MGYYNMIRPCVVGKLHYATVPVNPIEVDEGVAAPLVEAGSLEPYQPGVFVAPKLSLGSLDQLAPGASAAAQVGIDLARRATEFDDEPPTNPPPPRTRGGRRKSAED